MKSVSFRNNHGEIIRSFLGIPYGRAERFEKPKPPWPWKETLEAEKYVDCAQIRDVPPYTELGTEDCLVLNVFTTKLPKWKSVKRPDFKPVMVYIHGGSFTGGSGSPRVYGPQFLLDHDIVSPNGCLRFNF